MDGSLQGPIPLKHRRDWIVQTCGAADRGEPYPACVPCATGLRVGARHRTGVSPVRPYEMGVLLHWTVLVTRAFTPPEPLPVMMDKGEIGYIVHTVVYVHHR
jgi:hypothetical protein